MRRLALLLLLLFALPTISILAHAPNQSYVFLQIYEDEIKGRVEVTTDDLNKGFNWQLTRGRSLDELQPYIPELQAYILDRVGFSSKHGTHSMNFTEPGLFVLKKYGDYVQMNFTLDNINSIPDTLIVHYDVLFEHDVTHRGLLVIEHNWKAGVLNNEANVSLIFGPGNTIQDLPLTGSSKLKGLIAMIYQGMLHIWIGIDHILFLLALMLPSVVRRRREKDPAVVEKSQSSTNWLMNFAQSAGIWIPVPRFKPAFVYMIKIVTAFTIAHTITLSLGALNVVELPSRLVESVIALSIALAAYHNIHPLFKGRDWMIAFGFGLFHGFGFASVLGEIGLRGEFMVYSLFGFNVGVEIGQLVIICLIFPLLYFLRNARNYSKMLVYGSVILILISLYWFIERIFDIDMVLDNHFIHLYTKALQWIGIL